MTEFHYSLLTIFTGKVLDSYVLNGNLLEEIRILTARISGDDALPPQPVTEPSQVTVAVEWISQEVSREENDERLKTTEGFAAHLALADCLSSQRGQRVQRVERSGVHGGDLVVVERKETN